jgi:hypothetical protein
MLIIIMLLCLQLCGLSFKSRKKNTSEISRSIAAPALPHIGTFYSHSYYAVILHQPVPKTRAQRFQLPPNAINMPEVASLIIRQLSLSVTPEHTVYKISQWSPEILSARKVVLINEENVMFEAGVEVSLETKLTNNGIMVTIDVGVDAVHPLENLSNHAGEGFWEWHANSAGKHSFVVNVALNPSHQVFNISRRWHFGRPFVVLRILPEILESAEVLE